MVPQKNSEDTMDRNFIENRNEKEIYLTSWGGSLDFWARNEYGRLGNSDTQNDNANFYITVSSYLLFVWTDFI